MSDARRSNSLLSNPDIRWNLRPQFLFQPLIYCLYVHLLSEYLIRKSIDQGRQIPLLLDLRMGTSMVYMRVLTTKNEILYACKCIR
jgi:hypothetical protein